MFAKRYICIFEWIQQQQKQDWAVGKDRYIENDFCCFYSILILSSLVLYNSYSQTKTCFRVGFFFSFVKEKRERG